MAERKIIKIVSVPLDITAATDNRSDLAIQIDRIEEKIDRLLAWLIGDEESKAAMRALFNGPDPP